MDSPQDHCLHLNPNSSSSRLLQPGSSLGIIVAELVGHLKNDILLSQPLDQTNPSMPPEVLSSSIAGFLSDALEIDVEYIQDSWDILKFHKNKKNSTCFISGVAAVRTPFKNGVFSNSILCVAGAEAGKHHIRYLGSSPTLLMLLCQQWRQRSDQPV